MAHKDNYKYVYVTEEEFDSFIETLREADYSLYTINNRSERRVHITLESGVQIRFNLTALVKTAKGLCYSNSADQDVLRYNDYWGEAMNLTGKGSRSEAAWEEAKMIHSLMYS